MKIEENKIEYLKRPENVALAHEVCELFPRVEVELAGKIWTDIDHELDESSARLEGWTWKAVGAPEDRDSGVVIRPLEFDNVPIPDPEPARLFAQFGLQQEKVLDKFYVCLLCSKYLTEGERAEFETQAAGILERLRLQGYRIGTGYSVGTCVRWKYVQPNLLRGALLASIATDAAVARYLVTEFLGLFSELRDAVERLNQGLQTNPTPPVSKGPSKSKKRSR
jgi:hypothetical protein